MRGNIDIYIYMYIHRYILEEYWQIFVDDGLVPRDATDLQASAQPKALFSYDTTVMGKICCWDKEDKWGVSLYEACMSTASVCCVMDRKKHAALLEEKDAVNYGECQLRSLKIKCEIGL